ncbi:MAG: SCO family protein [Myxococcales bacterium]|nr:SCO family protein [Myxococcales bacterium]
MPKRLLTTLVLLGGLLTFAADARAQGPRGVDGGGRDLNQTSDRVLSPEANEVSVDEMLSAQLDMDLTFVDHDGKTVKLGDYFDGEHPVLITLNYYRCPTLCSLQLNGLTRTLQKLEWTPGEQFRIVTVSIDPRENTEVAAGKRASHLKELDRGEVDWNFLTGDALQVRMLAAQLGVGYAYDAEQDQYAHPAVLMFASPEGKVARYLYGLEYEPGDVKFALMEAAEGRVGSPVDKLILSCFHYDATLGKYGPFAMGFMRLGGVLMILIVGIPLVIVWRRERRRRLDHELEARA